MNALRTTQTSLRRHLRAIPLLIGCAFASGVALAATTTTEQWVPGRLLVQPNPGLPDTEFAKILKAHGAKSVGRIEGIDVHIVQLPANASEKAVATLLAKNPHLKFAERDMIVRPAGTANDTYFPSEWHLSKIGAPTAWDSSNGSGVTVAIIDTGVQSTHPDLAGQLVAGWNFYDNNSNTEDVHGHGTRVAGIAAAATNNGVGVASVAGGARIMPLRVADANGSASYSRIASALTYAADHDARVANLSFYACEGSSSAVSAAQYMKNKGGLVTTSAGNYAQEETTPPSDTMITVSATDGNDALASFSSYGSYVDVSAPGAGIYSTNWGSSYSSGSGTSYSAPVTAGVVALMMAANPSLGPADVQNLLYSTAKDLGASGRDKYFGYGRVDAAAAVAAAVSATARDTSAPSVGITSPSSGTTVKGLVSVAVSASDNVGVSRVDLYANGNLIASDISNPYGFSWDTAALQDGAATLTAYAYDAAGNYSTSGITVTIDNVADTIPPTTSISNPTSGAKVSGSVSVSAKATDNVGVSKVTLYIDGNQVAMVSGSTLSYSWNTRKANAGTHTLRVDAVDTSGNLASTSTQVTK